MQRLGAAEHRRQGLERGPHDVVLRLLRRERGPTGLRVEPERHRTLVLRIEPVPHDPGPQTPRGTELRDLLEEVHVAREEERQARSEVIDAQVGVERRLHVRDPVCERERDLLRGRRSGLAHVIPADRDRVPAGDPIVAIGEQVGDQPHRGLRRIDVRAACRVLLQEVVLDGPGEVRGDDALFLGNEFVEEQQDRRGGIDRHRRRHLVEGDPGEEPLHVLDRIDRDPGPADLTVRARMIRVQTHLGRQIERDRQARLAVFKQVAEPAVGVLGGPQACVLAHRPQTAAVHRGVRATRERECPGVAEAVVGVPSVEVPRLVERP